jgi:hypothetical protein
MGKPIDMIDVSSCGDCPCYHYGKDIGGPFKVKWDGNCAPKDNVSLCMGHLSDSRIPCDSIPKWCPLRINDVTIRLKLKG